MSTPSEFAVRRRAARIDLRLLKSRSRTPSHPDYGRYYLVDVYSDALVHGGQWGDTLDGCVDYLNSLD